MPDANPRKISVDSLLDNTFTKPSKEEFEELEETDRKRSGLTSDLTMSQGRRYNDGKKGKMNINKNILPYDQTRVKMKSPINGVDYINASWIQRVKESHVYDDVYEFLPASKINFLLTQDPTPDTEQHFYQMMCEQLVKIIVHIGSKSNLPKWNKISYGNVSKKLIDRVTLETNVIREKMDIFVKCEKSVIYHQITVYHFTVWPSDDQFGNVDSQNFLTLICLIQRDIGRPTKEFTIAAHDSSGGVEGASSFIVLFQMIQELETKLKVRKSELGDISKKRQVEFINLFEKVNQLRKERAHMVSTFENYKFLLTTLSYYARNKSTFDTILTTVEEVEETGKRSANPSRSSKHDGENEEDNSIDYDEDAKDGFFQDYSDYDTQSSHDVYVN